ncbi:hypothetical protein KPL71_021787 [Citrus sinensis]|uniref:Uncharacterized protein n=1 Tax=Citrus sinensis TaxID=2711 RepID=A0ACB8JI33_CITSI|nr:hypothetical protein KPL71_021787 [Citrus sinensis]
MLIASKSKDEIEKLKTQLNQDLSEAKKILGMEICRDRARGKVSLSQKQYLKKVLQQFGMTEQTKPVSTPLASHFKLSAQLSPSTDAEGEYMLQVPYSNAVGSLMYAIVCTRPDISYTVGIVSIYMHNPGKGHWQAMKWILRYIQKIVDLGLLFERDDTLGQGVIGYIDSDYTGNLDKRRSTTGYVFTFAGGRISWKSTLQSTVALSITEAEYMAITEVVKEAIWLQGLLENLGLAQEHINVYCDNQSAIHLTKNQVYHVRTKHIDVRFHFVREIVNEGKILLQKIKTADNPADMLTKLSKATNNFSRSNLIGQGSFGSVYKGIFYENEMIVAVKVINLKQKGASRSFAAECDALRSIRHRNLIKIITICSSIDHNGDDFKALVYEYMESGSLEEWLHQSNDQLGNCTLSLIQRLNIAIDVASAIEYLHHHCQPPIVHGDLKPSNVLLDQDMVAHVGDFGLARILSDQPLGTAPRTESSSIGIKGTVGYVAPEGVIEIVEPSLSLEVRTGNSWTRENGRVKIEECLVL